MPLAYGIDSDMYEHDILLLKSGGLIIGNCILYKDDESNRNMVPELYSHLFFKSDFKKRLERFGFTDITVTFKAEAGSLNSWLDFCSPETEAGIYFFSARKK